MAQRTKQPNKRRSKWFAFRLRESEREDLRAAAEKLGVWDSEFVREAIRDRVRDVLSSKEGK